MTRPKISVEKLRTRNEKVKDLKSALLASRWKWNEAQEQAFKLWDLIDHTCGFCILAMQKRTMEKGNRCDHCPTEIKEECDGIQITSKGLREGMGELIHETRVFLDGLKY